MWHATRLIPRSITAQITSIVAASVILGVGLVMTTVFILSDGGAEHVPAVAAARIADLSRLVTAANSAEEAAAIVSAAQRAGTKVRPVERPVLETRAADISPSSWPARTIAGQLESRWGVEVIEDARASADGSDRFMVGVGAYGALLFEAPAGLDLWHFVLAPTTLIVTIVLVFVTLLSVYAVRSIIAPLASVAEAARSFGRAADDTGVLSRSGPREITQVADALNDMRTRIRALLDERTRMLTAISHDLRTPLTRLRLRTERVGDQGLREGMMQEITRVTHMLDETLNYLREDLRSEHASRIDLPSILQTICAEFTDVGYAVSYVGPPRLTWMCQPNLLRRAISNVVDNAVKHGSIVTVTLRVQAADAVEIEVADDGPGIPAPLRERVFDAFFKSDDARTSSQRAGFGLGLSIARDVVRSHGGEIDLRGRTPHGLIVRMSLRAGTHPTCPPRSEVGPETTLNIT